MAPSAFLHLAFHWFKRAIRRIVHLGRPDGLRVIEASFVRQDDLAILDERERAALRAAGTCTSCGACDAAVAAELVQAQPTLPSAFVRSVTRNVSSLADCSDDAARVRKLDVLKLESSCPSRIGFSELLELVERGARRGPARS